MLFPNGVGINPASLRWTSVLQDLNAVGGQKIHFKFYSGVAHSLTVNVFDLFNLYLFQMKYLSLKQRRGDTRREEVKQTGAAVTHWRNHSCHVHMLQRFAAIQRKSYTLLTFSSPRFCNTSLPPLVRIATWGESLPLCMFAAGLSTPGELLLSLAGLLASWRVSRLAVLGVREPLWPTLRASKSMVLLSNASSTLQNKPPYFCRGTWSAVPGRAR